MKYKALNRRSFLTATAAFSIMPRHVIANSGTPPPSETVYAAAVGVGGQGRTVMQQFLRYGKIIALADVDPRQIANAKKLTPDAQVFEDYQELYSKLGNSFDAVIVATPDHWHALPSIHAMQLGKHVYLEKPLARTIEEVRALVAAANRYRVVTQMGNQGRSLESNRVFASWVQKGILGRITDVHTWVTMRLIDSKSKISDLQTAYDIPAGMNWEKWIGPAQFHNYNPAFCPGLWRGWTSFGTCNAGDWGCHLMDPIFTALDLQPPRIIQAEVTPGWDPVRDARAFPNANRITFEYELANRKTLKVLWHDGEFCNEVPRPPMLEPDRELDNKLSKEWHAGAVVYGTENALIYGSHGAGGARIIPEERMKGLIQANAFDARKNLGVGDHMRDFLNAIKAGRRANSDFRIAGLTAEAALLGSIACRNPNTKLEWNAAAMRFTNNPTADAMVMANYRKGYTLPS